MNADEPISIPCSQRGIVATRVSFFYKISNADFTKLTLPSRFALKMTVPMAHSHCVRLTLILKLVSHMINIHCLGHLITHKIHPYQIPTSYFDLLTTLFNIYMHVIGMLQVKTI